MERISNRWVLGFASGLLVLACFFFGWIAGKQRVGASVVRPSVDLGEHPGSPRLPSTGSVELPMDVATVFGRLSGASTETFATELDRGLAAGDFERKDVMVAFLIRWVMEDADGAADHLLGKFSDWDSEDAEPYMDVMERFMMVWLKQDYAGLLKYTQRMVDEGHPLAEDFEELCAMGGSEANPVAYLSSLRPEDYAQKRWEVGMSLETLAAGDPQAALEFFGSMPVSDRNVRESFLCHLAAGLARGDPELGLSWATGLELEGERRLALDHLLAGLATVDVDAAAEAFGKLSKTVDLESAQGSLKAFERIVFEYAQQDLSRALKWLEETAGGQSFGSRTLDPLLPFAPRDPAEFRRLLEELEPSAIRSNLVIKMPIDYRSNPVEFLSKLSAMPDDDLRRQMLNAGLDQWIRQDPEVVKEAVLELPEGIRGRAGDRVLASRDSFDSVAEGIDYALRTGADPLRAGFSFWMGAREDAADAADYFASQPLRVREGTQPAAYAFVQAWAGHSPHEALAWMDTLGEDRALVAGGLAGGWLRSDPVAASAWATTLEEGEMRDEVAGSIATVTMYEDPEASLAWALEVSDESKREQHLRRTFQPWLRSDPEAARRALWTEGVPESLREAFLNE